MPDLEQRAKSSKEAADTFRSMATINMMIALKKGNTSETDVRTHEGSATEWQQDILWSVRNSDAGGSIDCPNEYVPVARECIVVGGRSCLMRKAIDAANVNHQAEAVRLSLITQCHNPAAADQIRNLGPQALTAYLTSTAAESMGERLWVGFGSVKVDFTEARKYFLIAANHGNARGMANVGWIYENGFDVPQDYSEAKFWYDKAISHGDVIANWNIGRLYEFGWGVQMNLDAARSWYQKGADKGHAASRQALDNVGHNNPMKM
jgi:TPR repeat protein